MAKKGRARWLIGGAVIAVAVGAIAMLKLGDFATYFLTPSEAYARGSELDGQTVKVGGMVKVGTVKWQSEQLALAFTMTDLAGHEIDVKHTGTPPDMFKEGSGVVVEGRLESGGKAMTSRNLMVKHSEEYKKAGDPRMMDKMLMEKSLFKGEETKP